MREIIVRGLRLVAALLAMPLLVVAQMVAGREEPGTPEPVVAPPRLPDLSGGARVAVTMARLRRWADTPPSWTTLAAVDEEIRASLGLRLSDASRLPVPDLLDRLGVDGEDGLPRARALGLALLVAGAEYDRRGDRDRRDRARDRGQLLLGLALGPEGPMEAMLPSLAALPATTTE